MGRAGSRLSRLARVRHHPRRTAFTGRPAPHPARPTNPTPPTELTTEPPNRHHTNRIRRHRIASQGAGPTSGHIYTGNRTPRGGGRRWGTSSTGRHRIVEQVVGAGGFPLLGRGVCGAEPPDVGQDLGGGARSIGEVPRRDF